jgi:hypothetical protein
MGHFFFHTYTVITVYPSLQEAWFIESNEIASPFVTSVFYFSYSLIYTFLIIDAMGRAQIWKHPHISHPANDRLSFCRHSREFVFLSALTESDGEFLSSNGVWRRETPLRLFDEILRLHGMDLIRENHAGFGFVTTELNFCGFFCLFWID